MLRVLTKDELLNLMAGLPPSVMAMDSEETITILAATVIEQQAEIERLRDALHQMVSAVCAETGFANAVRLDSGSAYPWPALDIAEENASAALGATK